MGLLSMIPVLAALAEHGDPLRGREGSQVVKETVRYNAAVSYCTHFIENTDAPWLLINSDRIITDSVRCYQDVYTRI